MRIFHGDIYTQPSGGRPESSSSGSSGPQEFEIAHKPPDKVRAMSQTVYDNDYVVAAMTEAGWPLRWQNWSAGGSLPRASAGRVLAIARRRPLLRASSPARAKPGCAISTLFRDDGDWHDLQAGS